MLNRFAGLSTTIISRRLLAETSFKFGAKKNQTMSTGKSFKVLVTHPEVPQEGLDILKEHCEIIQVNSLPTNRAELLEKIKGVDGAFWGGHEKLNAEVLDAAGPQFKSVSTMSAGIDFVDVPELKKRGIPLGHTPTVLNTAVADLAVGLVIAASRRFQEARKKIDTDNWENYHLNWLLGQDIRDSTVGFYGFGGIGQAIAKRLLGFDIDQVLYTTRRRVHKEIEEELKAKKVDFDTLLAQSDFIVIASPLTADTQGVFNTTAFNKMKETAVLVNIGRGKIVNQDDLYEALKSNRIFAAGLDVTDPEPLAPTDKLLALDNAVVLPHIGSATKRTRAEMATIAAHNVLRGLAGEPMLSPAYFTIDLHNREMSSVRKAFKVLVSHPNVPLPALELLRSRGAETIICQSVPPSREEILQKVPGVDAIYWAHYQPLNAGILDAAGPQLRCVSTMSSGIDFVDVPEFKRRQLRLGHTPGVVQNSVADLAIGLMIAAGRNFHTGRNHIESSEWKTEQINWLMGHEIRDSVIGFFGFGGIAQAIAKRLQCWDVAKIIYHTRTRKANDVDLKAEHVSFETLLKESDFLVVAAPLTDETRGKFNSIAFKQMKPTSIFVNVARGGLVNQKELHEALTKGTIFAAGLDVTTPEPLPADDPILKLPNCVVLPHLGTQTMKTTMEMSLLAANNILNAIEGKPMIRPAY
ncbi:uncharacterized protein [Drosophila tropicalis]|uniref:uncharacterized protein n=1 Tax=Drosophila tropicalis TaxID=46794 RepID=UPI0035ABCD84